MTEIPIFEKLAISKKKPKGDMSIEINDSPFARLEEGKEMSLLDPESLNSPKVQQLVLMLKEWVNQKLARENIVVRDLQEDLYDGQIIHKIMQLSDPNVPFFAEVVQAPAHQRDKIKSLLDYIEAHYRKPSEFSWTAEQIHSKDFVAIVRLLVTLINQFDPLIRFPDNVLVTCNRYVRSNGAVRPVKAHLENLTSNSSNQQSRDAFDTMFEQAPEKLAKTKRQCLAFVNGYLDRLGLSVTDIEKQLSDGFLLLLLLGMLGDFFVPLHACHQTPANESEKLANVRFAFELMKDMDVPLKRVTPEDVVAGDAKALIRILHTLSAKFAGSV